MFTLDIFICIFVNVTIKRKDGFRPILCVCVCVSIDTMLNFDGDVDANADANVKCEHSISHYKSLRPQRAFNRVKRHQSF